jgi:hypothetical protein
MKKASAPIQHRISGPDSWSNTHLELLKNDPNLVSFSSEHGLRFFRAK